MEKVSNKFTLVKMDVVDIFYTCELKKTENQADCKHRSVTGFLNISSEFITVSYFCNCEGSSFKCSFRRPLRIFFKLEEAEDNDK